MLLMSYVKLYFNIIFKFILKSFYHAGKVQVEIAWLFYCLVYILNDKHNQSKMKIYKISVRNCESHLGSTVLFP